MLNPTTERNVPRATKRPFCGFFWLIHGIEEIGVISIAVTFSGGRGRGLLCLGEVKLSFPVDEGPPASGPPLQKDCFQALVTVLCPGVDSPLLIQVCPVSGVAELGHAAPF